MLDFVSLHITRPESLGVVSGVVYFIALILLEFVFFYEPTKSRAFSPLTSWLSTPFSDDSALINYNATLHSILFMLFLGFVDDVVDLPWRYKIILPPLSSLPLLIAYRGGTSVLLPKLVGVIGLPTIIELGILYKVYMCALAVFCGNSINILAGINGLEAGQSYVIALAVAIHNIIELHGMCKI